MRNDRPRGKEQHKKHNVDFVKCPWQFNPVSACGCIYSDVHSHHLCFWEASENAGTQPFFPLGHSYGRLFVSISIAHPDSPAHCLYFTSFLPGDPVWCMFALDMYHFYQPQAPICADTSTSSYQLCWETTSGISCRACFVGGALNGAGARLEAPVVITDPLKLEIRKTSLTE